VPVNSARLPRVPRGPRRGRRSRADDAARSPGHNQADEAPPGPRPAPGTMSAGGVQNDWPGQDADIAVVALYSAHYTSLARIAALLVGVAVAEQVVQDAFVSAQRELRRGQDDKALACLRRAVVTGARARLAAQADPRRGAGSGPPAPGTANSALMAALCALPARQREALVLRYYANWPDPQIAAAMGICGLALDGHVRRGITALRACLTAGRGSGA
jgi:DNA-directed RNA polymerase specialized sigma24 family protein